MVQLTDSVRSVNPDTLTFGRRGELSEVPPPCLGGIRVILLTLAGYPLLSGRCGPGARRRRPGSAATVTAGADRQATTQACLSPGSPGPGPGSSPADAAPSPWRPRAGGRRR